jgi:hypothetical protein
LLAHQNNSIQITLEQVFMKIFAMIIYLFLSMTFASVAAMPTKIFLVSQANTDDGDTYYIYQVECDDGRKPTIYSWEDNKKWCLGASKSQCETTRLKAAAAVCKNA